MLRTEDVGFDFMTKKARKTAGRVLSSKLHPFAGGCCRIAISILLIVNKMLF